MDLFEKIRDNRGPLGIHAKDAHGYFTFPKLEGELSSKMTFRGKEVLLWSLNNYLGLGNLAKVRNADEQASKDWGLGYPMGSRMMSGNTSQHEKLEKELSKFVEKEDSFLLNFGYQGVVSIIDALVDRNDVIVYDSDSHACIIDGVRLHAGKRFVYPHNNIENLTKQLERATNITKKTGGAILVITEGVFGMTGNLGKLKEIITLKQDFNFRLLVDDAHGFGTMGKNGRGTGEYLDVQSDIDLYFSTFAKSMASIGAFVSSTKDVVEYLKYNMRSQIFAKSLPMPLVIGALKRLDIIKNEPQHKEHLWKIVNALQSGLRKEGFELKTTESPVTPVYLSGGVGEATNLTVDLRENHGLFCSIVTYPVVPKGVIMLRLIPTAMHSIDQVNYTIKCFKKVKNKLANGEYISEKIAKI